MKKNFSNRMLAVLLMAGFFLLSVALTNAVDIADIGDVQGQGCKECHENIYEAAEEMVYAHSIVQDCAACHILDGADAAGSGTGFQSSDLSNEVLLYLKALPGMASPDASYLVEVEASDRYGRGSQMEKLNLKPSEIEEAFLEPSLMPAFDSVGVDSISMGGVFPEATIVWTTSVYAETTLEYGTDQSYGSKAFTGKPRVAYYKKHVARLPELKRNKTYHFRITAKDVSGRIFQSESQSFTTEAGAQAGKSSLRSSPVDGDPVIESVRALRSADGKVGVLVIVNKPVRVSLKVSEDKDSEAGYTEARHGAGFLSARASRIDVCVGCHSQGISHPVGIRANTLTTRMPVGLPTLKGGIITCNTCHTPHGGNLKFFARIDFEDTTMCAQCHTTDSFI